MTSGYAEGFAPVYDEKSRVLILGSFPSVKSREIGFYYGNPQNKFWRTVCGFFGEEVPQTVGEKRTFLLRRKIALWDVIASCEIVGSSDASIRNEVVADIAGVLAASNISAVLCNGSKSYSLFAERFPQYITIAKRLTSTSPANPRFNAEEWRSALESIYREEDHAHV